MSNTTTLSHAEELTRFVYEIDADDISDEQMSSVKLHAEELVTRGFLRVAVIEDDVYYMCSETATRTMCLTLTNNIQQKIMQFYFSNNKGTFVLFNTQKGKSAIISKEIQKICTLTSIKPVSYIVVSNDKTLADQSASAFQSALDSCGCKVFTLSSSSTTSFSDIQLYIEDYASDEDNVMKIPAIVLLANTAQANRMIRLMERVNRKNRRNINIKNLVFFDEADETYPIIRDRSYDGNSFLDLINEELPSFSKIFWVSATNGELLDIYPECANALNYIGDPDEVDSPNYRAIHHADSIIKSVKASSRESKNGYAEKVIKTHLDHFKGEVTLANGSKTHRKIIVNSNPKISDMREFARFANNLGFNVVIFNMYGLTVHICGDGVVKKYSTKGKRFNQTLYEIFIAHHLDARPTIIIGNRKVNRGMTFHYAPADGSNGLIWTDIILGNIEDVTNAVQKAGRAAGKIAQCPQYPGKIYYWTTNKTASIIQTHNRCADYMNRIPTNCTIQEALQEAVNNPDLEVVIRDFDVTELYDDKEVLKNHLKQLIPVGHITKYTLSRENTIQYRGNTTPLIQYQNRTQFMKLDIYWGIDKEVTPKKIACRIMPVTENDTVKWIGIHSKAAVAVNR